jgi:hypothetical protein
MHGYLVIAFPEIHFTEDGAAGHCRGKIHYVGQRICIRDGEEISPAVITAGPQLPSGFLTMCKGEA